MEAWLIRGAVTPHRFANYFLNRRVGNFAARDLSPRQIEAILNVRLFKFGKLTLFDEQVNLARLFVGNIDGLIRVGEQRLPLFRR